MSRQQEKSPVLAAKQALLAAQRADALRANLKKRKEQSAARTTDKKETESQNV